MSSGPFSLPPASARLSVSITIRRIWMVIRAAACLTVTISGSTDCSGSSMLTWLGIAAKCTKPAGAWCCFQAAMRLRKAWPPSSAQ